LKVDIVEKMDKNLGGEKKKKMKKKIAVLVGIVVYIVLLVSPTLASSADTIDIYGNANEDDTIDMRDLTYVKLIFFGKKPETELADAKFDGKINPLDFIQIKLIIVGKEKELTVVDDTITDTHPDGKPVTVKKPVNRIILLNSDAAEAIKVIDAEDKVVGVTSSIPSRSTFFPELSKLPCVGKWKEMDIEKILSLNPDLVVGYGGSSYSNKMEEIFEDLPITVVKLQFYVPEIMAEDIKKLGYILGKVEEAEEYNGFEDGCMSTMNEGVGRLSEDEKPRVYLEWATKAYGTYTKGSGTHQVCTMAGGINIAADLSGPYAKVDPEWVITQNPDVIFKHQYAGSGYEVDNPSEMKARWDEVMNRPELANVRAIKEEKVYLISSDILYGPGYFVGIAYIAKWFHPEFFADLNPQAIHQEYINEFCSIDYDVTHGVFVYPLPAS
jgi:iron complex transport system substrate-binding protein